MLRQGTGQRQPTVVRYDVARDKMAVHRVDGTETQGRGAKMPISRPGDVRTTSWRTVDSCQLRCCDDEQPPSASHVGTLYDLAKGAVTETPYGMGCS